MPSARLSIIEGIAVVCGAVIGGLAYLFAASLISDAPSLFVAGAFESAAVALITTATFAVYYRYMARTPAALVSFFTGVALPTLVVAVTVGGALSATSLFACAVFSLVALLVYRFVFANNALRAASGVGKETSRSPI